MGPKGLVLVFNRSADWCPYGKTQLVEMQGRVDALRQQGLGLASITYDPVPVLADFASRRGITFPILSDAGSATIRNYGILNTTVPETNSLFGYPFPGTFILNREGIVTSRFFEDTYQERDTISSVLVRLGSTLDTPVTKTSAPHLEIKPENRVHVYAPDVSGYKSIALTVQPQAGAEDYFFEPLNEHVPVYQRPFRVVQDVMLDPSREAAAALRDHKTMTIAATLNYQACDDKLCFNPQSVPLSWTVNVRSLNVERAKRP